jgi:hypothetical protein
MALDEQIAGSWLQGIAASADRGRGGSDDREIVAAMNHQIRTS